MAAMVVRDLLLAIVVALTFACAVGVWAMRDPYQRMHFVAPPASLASFLLVAAVIVDEKIGQAAWKTLLVAIALSLVNGVVTHATARAARVRARGSWQVQPDEEVVPVEESC